MSLFQEKLEIFSSALVEISGPSLVAIILSSIGIYAAVIILTRIVGKRSFSKMSSFDFAMTVAVGSIIATTILSDSVNLAYGIIGLSMVYLLQAVAAFFRRYQWFRRMIDNEPTMVMYGHVLLRENMSAVKVTEGDIRSKLREANVTKLSQVKAVIFETTGVLVVLHSDSSEPIEEWILKDVQR
jgi:uncharacterized membrane protein YcaP (DUF421 family)